MSGALHARLREEALRTGQSLNQLCVTRLDANGQLPAKPGRDPVQAGLLPAGFLEKIVLHWPEDLVGLILFGSAARGDATEDSDIDLLLVMRSGVKITRALYRLWDESFREPAGARDDSRASPHFVILPGSVREAGGLWYEAAIDGIALWECDRRVSRFLGSVREAMGQGRIQRRMLHGSPYWIREDKESNA